MSAPSDRRVVLLIAVATLIIPLNSTMIAVALPSVIDDFDVDVAGGSWLVSTYLIAMAALQPVMGKLGDRLGRRRVILGALGLFGAGSALAAVAPTFGLLVIARVAQGVAAATLFPNVTALIRLVLPADRRGRAFGAQAAAVGLGAALGLPLGGVLAELGGWQAIFWVNVPIVIALGVVAAGAVPAAAQGPAAASFDLQGAALLLALLTGVATLLTVLDEVPVAVTVAGVAAVAAGAAAFALVERRHADPVLRPGLLGRGTFGAAVGAVTLANLSLYGTLLAIPLLFSAAAGWSELRIGLVLTSVSVAMIAASVLGGRLADRVERRHLAVAGFALFGAGLLPLAVALEDVATVVLVAGLAVAGVGAGLANPALQAAALDAVDDADAAVASGVYSTGRYLGGIVAASLLAVAVGGSADGFGVVLGVCVAAAFASAALALALPGRPAQVAYTTRLRA